MKNMIGVNSRKSLTIVIVGLVAVLLLGAVPVMADDEAGVEAEVEVLPQADFSYGHRVMGSWRTFLNHWTLEEPDNRGATLLWKSWISIRLEDNVPQADTISVWAANSGWWPSRINIYISANGWRWTRIGSRQVWSANFAQYDFTGSFGNVKYIKVERSGRLFSVIRLDAVGAKGGDASG